MPVKWDIVVLTAGNLKQKKALELQISAEHKQHFKEHYVIRDQPPGVKIGSGGATLNALSFLHNIYGDVLFEKKILVLHSGGYSQRLPHVAALGKLFMLMPSGKTLFEHKLQSYRARVRCKHSPGHGVYVLNDDLKLEMVLQKPSLKLLQERARRPMEKFCASCVPTAIF
uniref:L-fucokinase domain-containing protein n=1 Tax=Ditylenchus dipsaci TaxID=166011 RepID=A0A915D1R7_9BILA